MLYWHTFEDFSSIFYVKISKKLSRDLFAKFISPFNVTKKSSFIFKFNFQVKIKILIYRINLSIQCNWHSFSHKFKEFRYFI